VIRITKGNERGNLKRKMQEKFETVERRDKYAGRIQIMEPVFADIRYCKELNRFTLRGKDKVNIQWLLFCIVHNLCKYLNGRNEILYSS
jgi:translation elongation factor EF-1alpha